MIKFTFGKCKTRAAYSAKLNQKGKIDLEKIKQKYSVVLETPILVMIKVKRIEIIVHGHGELIFKSCEKVDWMEKTAEEIYNNSLVK